MNKIIMKHVSKSFGQTCVLSSINLEIQEGEIFGLLGPSGAGKTTIVKILSGQLSYQGSVWIDQQECKNHTDAWLKTIGMSMDEFGFYRRLSIWDNLCMFAKLRGVSKQRVIDVLRQLSLYDERKSAICNLSKGMKQRLSFANAILHEPSLIFLDEPTNGLDPNTMKELHDMIKHLNEQGTTIFLTTHNMEEAEKLCDHVALLNEGVIVEYGAPKDICLKYHKVKKYDIQLRNGKQYLLQQDEENVEKINTWLKQDQIETIHSCEPTLESVFLEVTGRKLS